MPFPEFSSEAVAKAPEATWSPGRGRGRCGRDPAAGPGSCPHWWGGCPRAEQRGCYRLWLGRLEHDMGAAGT